MSTHPESTDQDDEHTQKTHSLLNQLRILLDAATDPEVRVELQEEMSCVAMSWYLRKLDEEDESPPQTKPQANATALQS